VDDTPAAQTTATRQGGIMSKLEAIILEAARKNDDRLDGLLREASEIMDEEQASRLFAKVEQIMREGYCDACDWNIPQEEVS
jgi:hypothetical protein